MAIYNLYNVSCILSDMHLYDREEQTKVMNMPGEFQFKNIPREEIIPARTKEEATDIFRQNFKDPILRPLEDRVTAKKLEIKGFEIKVTKKEKK